MASWSKDEVRERIQKYTNTELLDETLQAAGGDDYDGGFTSYGLFVYDELTKELQLRLADWLTKGESK